MTRQHVARAAACALTVGALAFTAAVGFASGSTGVQASEHTVFPETQLSAPPASAVPEAPSLPAREMAFPALSARPAYTVYVPEGPDVPRPAVMVLHGMGGSGPGIATQLLSQARDRNWIVIAPTVPYGDWRDPNQLTGEELRLLPQLSTLIDYVRDEAGVKVAGKVMLFGFSRGAQAALRFSMLYPERVGAVAALSAGTYTVPVRWMLTASGPAQAPMPFGVFDIEQRAGRGIDALQMTGIRYWIGVGAGDNREGDVPRQWDQFLGKTRVERATRFGAVLSQLGCETYVSIVPNAGHEIVPAMMDQITGFLGTSVERAQMHAEAGVAALPRPARGG